MKKIKKIKIKNYSNSTGSLVPVAFNKSIPINAKRIFFIYGKKNKIRGNHAHKKASQLFIPVSGKMVLSVLLGKNKKKFLLSRKTKNSFLIPPKHWCSIRFINTNSILMVVSNRYYESSDYIRNFKEYLKYLGKYK